MGDPRMAAARMTDRPQRYDEPTGGTPGIGLTGMDIAGALSMGGANRAEMLMVMYKWVQDKSAQQPLFYVVYDEVVKLATKKKWRIPVGEEILRRMTMLAIIEVCDPKCCPTCGGRREVWRKGWAVPVTCNACNGTGRAGWREMDRCKVSGISASSWSKTWSKRYEEVAKVVRRFDSAGLSALRNGVGE